MKIYWLAPSEGTAWLTPEEVAQRVRSAFARVDISSETAEKHGNKLIAKYRVLLGAGLGAPNSTSIEELEHRWSGALSVVIAVGDGDGEWFQTMVCNEYRLELVFGPGVSRRRQRPLAIQVAGALGYSAESIDGD